MPEEFCALKYQLSLSWSQAFGQNMAQSRPTLYQWQSYLIFSPHVGYIGRMPHPAPVCREIIPWCRQGPRSR